jgi:hypothetical protein
MYQQLQRELEKEARSTLPRSLPPNKELREEAKANRKAKEPFKVFEHFNQAEQEYLLNMVDTLGVNQEAGAQAMLDLGQKLLGIEAAAEEAVTPEAIEEAKEHGFDEDQYRQMVREEMEQQQQVAAIYAETEAAGFDPESEEAALLWDLAVTLNEPDLAKVAPIVRERLGLEAPVVEEPVVEVEEEPAAVFPRTPAIPTGTGGTNAEATPEPPALGSDELRERVARRIRESFEPG